MYAPFPRPFARTPDRRLSLALMLVVLLTTLLNQRPLALPVTAPAPAPAPPIAARDFGRLPLPFIPNVGQIDSAVGFVASDKEGTIFFTHDGIVLTLPAAGEGQKTKDEEFASIDNKSLSSTVLHMHFEAANPSPEMLGDERLPGVVNYFLGNDPAKWHTNVPTYAGIAYQQLYDGIDLRYDGHEGTLKGTYIVAPNADPLRIRWWYEGAQDVRVDAATGDLVIAISGTSSQSLREKAPLVWQDINGRRIPVTARYALAADGSIGFALSGYDHTQPLTIDPTLEYSGYLGGNGNDVGNGIAVDAAGNVYVTGYTMSSDFPLATGVLSGTSDAFVSKLSATGTLLYSTYIGGSSNDGANGIKLDSAGNIYLVGSTASLDFPKVNPLPLSHGTGTGASDVFVAKLNAENKELLFSTFFGGVGDDNGNAIAVDNAGNAYLSGSTFSSDFPTKSPLQSNYGGATECSSRPYPPCGDAFVAKVNTIGQGLGFSTYLGGSEYDYGQGIAVDNTGDAYITGITASTNFITTTNAFQTSYGGAGGCASGSPPQGFPCADAFVTKIKTDGTLAYSTYLGGNSNDQAYAIAVDSTGSAYVTGETISPNFPTVNPYQASLNNGASDLFITKITPGGNALSYSTYLGGNSVEIGEGITLDNAGNTYVTGWTSSSDFPIKNAVQDSFNKGLSDVFVLKLNTEDNDLLFSTYLGGSDDSSIGNAYTERGNSIAADTMGNAYITGSTSATNFPTVKPIDSALHGPLDAFVAKISTASTWYVAATTGNDASDCTTPTTACKTIAAAMSKAVSGDSIWIAGGTYNENLMLDKDLQLLGAGSNSTIIDGDRKGKVIVVGSNIAAYISGITIQNGMVTTRNGPEAIGAGITNAGRLTVVDSAISQNSLSLPSTDNLFSGGIYNVAGAILTITNSIIDGNHGVGIRNDEGQVTLIATTVSNNLSSVYGGGIRNTGIFTVTNSTVSGNRGNAGGGIANMGSGTLIIQNSTISHNQTDFSTLGGGLYNEHGLVKIQNSIVANSFLSGDPPKQGVADCAGLTTITSLGYNLISDTTGCSFTPTTGDQMNVDPKLGPLQDNGGRILTHALLPGSPAIDAGSLTDCPATDQRGVARPQGSRCDIGAYEYDGHLAPGSHLHLAKTASAPTARPGDALTYTVTVSATEGAATASLSDALPVGLTYVDGSASGGATYDAATRQIRFNGQVAPGTDVTITYRATVDAGVPAGSVLINTASVTGTGYLLQRSAGVAVEQPTFNGTLVLIYTSGDNNLSKEMLELINKAEKDADNPNITTLLVLDGPGSDDSYLYRLQKDNDDGCPNYGNPTCDGRYVEGRDFWPLGEDVASPYALAEFLKGAERAYPNARQVVLSLVGHGGGWSPEVLADQPSGHGNQPSDDPLGGLLWDDHPGETLSTPALGKALRWSKQATGRSIDLLYLDACLMGMSEVAYEVRDSVHYLLASESWKWAAFPYDAHLASITATMDARQIGVAWLRNEASALPDSYPFTYSLLDLTALDSLRAATDHLATALTGALAQSRDHILEAFNHTECFDSSGDGAITPDDNYCDLDSFVHQIQARLGDNASVMSATTEVRAAVAAAVVDEAQNNGVPWNHPTQRWSWNKLGGISIYLPLHEDSWKRRYYYRYLGFTHDGQWDEFLDAWWNNAAPPPDPTCPPNCSLPPGQLPVAPFALHAASGYGNIQLDWDATLPRVTSFRVSRAISGTATFEQVATTSDTSYRDAALERGKAYCYQIDGLQADGSMVAESNIDCATFGLVDLWVPDVWAQPGTTALVPVNIRNADGLRIAASDIWLDFDPKVISATGVQATPLTEGSYTFQAGTETPGRVKIAAISSNSPVLYDAGTLFWVQVEVAGNLGDTSPLNLREYISGVGGSTIFASDDLSHAVPLELHDGTLRVGNAFVLGDVSGDGLVAAIDALIVEQIASGQYTPTADQQAAGDVNGDGTIDAADGVMILYYAAHGQWPSTATERANSTTSDKHSADTPGINLSLDDASGAPGTLAQTTLRVSDLANWAGGDFVITYDPAVIKDIANVSVTGLANGFTMAFHDNHAGLLRISMAGATPVSGNGVLATIMLRIAPGAKPNTSTTLVFGDAHLCDNLGRDFAASALQHTITRSDAQVNVMPMRIFLPVVVK